MHTTAASGRTRGLAASVRAAPQTARSLAAALAVAAFALSAVGCGGNEGEATQPQPPQPGVLEVRLVTPNADDRALRVSITGGPVSAVQTPNAALTVHGSPGATGALVIVVGQLATGVVARVDVPDVNRAADYRAVLVDVADVRYQLRPDGLPGYTATVTRQGGP